ncbi:calmodulin-binding transcription activator 4 isoform X1 [Silene latifolia]|uniref:calmodulin-binding transcription activator 4 isoform X1 n=1 Tax=Silene latifolia TaxID=37657 RepID=UPI003D780802
MQSGFDINQLLLEAQRRWLKPAEVLFILQNHQNYQITPEAPLRPPGGSLFLFNKRVLRFFRKDGHNWRKKKDGRTVGEAHERLKVGIAEAINCYYAHGEDNPSFQRRSYWMLDPAYEHIVLVHYRETSEGKLSPGSIADPSPGPSVTLSQSTSSFTVQNPGSSSLSESYQNHLSPGSLEVSSNATMAKGFDYLNGSNVAQNSSMMSESEVSQALRRLEMQLSLDDDSLKEYVPPDDLDGNEDKYCILDDYNSYPGASHSNGSLSQPDPGCNIAWDDVFGLPKDSQQLQLGGLDGKRAYVMNSSGNIASAVERPAKRENYQAQCVGANTGEKWIEAPEDLSTLAYSSQMYPVSSELSMMLLDPSIGMPVAIDSSLTVAKEQRFTIRTLSPEWGFANDSTKVIIVGSFLCDPSDCTWHCMFGDVEVPLQVLQDGVFTCHAPSHLSGKVTLCITSGNRESCSEIKEFEYREKHSTCKHCDKREEETSRGTEEMLLLLRLVKMLLSDIPINRGGNNELEVDLCLKDKGIDNSWDQIMEALLVGGGSSTTTLEWLLQQLIKDKLQQWLSSHTTGVDSFLSRKEQGVIHMISGLGYEWALNPLLDYGVGVNFRDINGWTALHWAARFGREKMVAALIASGASALAVTDPSANDPTGRNAAYIAAANGHKGLAGYLSEVALTSHLSSLTMEETELSKGSADVEAELTVNNISKEGVNSLEDQVSLKHTLAAVRNAAQAAARIQAAFRAHSFRKRQQGEASGSSVDEYGFALNDTQGISAASKLAFHNLHYNHKAALSIQKNYRGWKGRKDFVSLRQKVVKIQAHVRGHQVRKKYKVICWAVGILDKAVLRWRRKGVGLRGYKPEVDCVNDEEDEDIIKVFRKEKVNVAIDEAVSRVLSMVDSPDARHQYQRMIGKFQEAKAVRQGVTSPNPSTSQDDVSDMDNDRFPPSGLDFDDFLTFP